MTTTDPSWTIAPTDGTIHLERTETGRFALPLTITYGDRTVSHITQTYSGGQIEELHRQMRALIAAGAPEPPQPTPRPARGTGGSHAEDRRAQKAEMGQWH